MFTGMWTENVMRHKKGINPMMINHLMNALRGGFNI